MKSVSVAACRVVAIYDYTWNAIYIPFVIGIVAFAVVTVLAIEIDFAFSVSVICFLFHGTKVERIGKSEPRGEIIYDKLFQKRPL